MKKLFFTFVLCAIYGVASAQTVSVSDIEIKAGQKAAFTFVVNVGDNEFTGIECTKFVLPEGLTISGTAVAESWDKEAYNDTGNNSDGTFRFAFTSTKDVAIPQNQNIAIGSIELAANSGLTSGTVLTVTIPANEIKFVPGSIPYTEEISFNVTVRDYITLDENSVTLPEKASSDVKVLRSFKAGEWSTICLPFAMTTDKLRAAFGDDYELAYISGCETKTDGDRITGINVQFTKRDQALQVNRPYIIKPSKDVEVSFDVESATINPTDGYKTAISIEDDDTGEEVETCSMTGNLKAGTIVPAKSLFLSEGSFWYSTGKTKMKAFRAYFTFKDVLSSLSDASGVRFYVGDGENLTEIQIPEFMPNDGEYYDLKGQRVETPSKGIYIKDGKKVVVK